MKGFAHLDPGASKGFKLVTMMLDQIKRWNLKRFSPMVGLLLFCAALVVLHHSVGSFRIRDVLAFVEALPNQRVWAAFTLVVVNFLLFTGYDLLALRYIGHRLPLRKVATTAMLGFSFSNVAGGMVLGGGGIRYRAYESAGLSAVEILRISLFIWMSWIVGVATLNGIAACAFPHLLDALQWPYMPDLRWFGVPLCLLVAGYLHVGAYAFSVQWHSRWTRRV